MELVEGVWKEFEFRRASPADVGTISELLKTSYFPNERLSVLVDYEEDYVKDFETIWSSFLDQNLGFIAYHKATGKAVGVRMAFNRHKDMDWNKYKLTSNQTAVIMTIVKELDVQSDLFNKYNIENYMELFVTCVHRDFRNQGLVTEMYRRAVLLGRAKGFFLAKACFSSPYSRKGATNNGFRETARILVKNARDETGTLLFPNAADEDLLTQSILIL